MKLSCLHFECPKWPREGGAQQTVGQCPKVPFYFEGIHKCTYDSKNPSPFLGQKRAVLVNSLFFCDTIEIEEIKTLAVFRLNPQVPIP